jgi:hypothetical protein
VFRQLPGTSIYSPRIGVFQPSRPVQGLELIVAVQTCLGRQSPAARLLLTWARARAERKVTETCRETGRARSTVYYQRNRSLENVALWLNRERGLLVSTVLQQSSYGQVMGQVYRLLKTAD